MKEQNIYQIIKKLVDTNGNKKKAAIRLGCTERYVNKLITKYRTEGKAGFVHKNSGRQPKATISKETKERIISLYKNKYYDFNWSHFTEKLNEDESIKISYTPLRHILTSAGFISPLCNRSTRRAKKKELEAKNKLTEIDKNVIIDDHILDSDSSHPRKPRAKYFGELIQMDASGIVWFGNTYATLHLAVDDATGTVVGAFFDYQETLYGYYMVLKQILLKYGIPNEFFTDNRTVFTYKSNPNPTDENDTYTQFAYACKSLGISIKTSSVPQKKGRIERFNQTFQNRLPQEMRTASIKTLEQANEFLTSYLPKFNNKFALQRKNISSVFESQPSLETINLTLAILTSRKFDSGSSISFHKKYYQATNATGTDIIRFRNGTEGLVIQTLDKKLFITVDERVYPLKELPERTERSKEFDEPIDIKTKKIYIPPMTHPWKKASFDAFLAKQKHRLEYNKNGANV
ncbi:MAG: ISNCY family transposase [Candidatus Coprovivens sp.]